MIRLGMDRNERPEVGIFGRPDPVRQPRELACGRDDAGASFEKVARSSHNPNLPDIEESCLTSVFDPAHDLVIIDDSG